MKKSPEITELLRGLLPPEGRIADVGCGDGALLRSLRAPGRRLVGVEPFLPAEAAEEDGILWLRGWGEALPLEDGSADAVILQCVFSLCPPEATAAEVYRVLKPGGTLLLPDLYSEGEELTLTESGLLGRVDRRETLEARFAPRFRREVFRDETGALTGLLAQAILDGEDGVIPCGERLALRRARARYGVWVWKKNCVC